MDMTEKVARAVFAAGFHPSEEPALIEAKWNEWPSDRRSAFTKARAALKAMREPNEAMASAGMRRLSELPDDAGWMTLAREGCQIWRAMIDAALSDSNRSGEAMETGTGSTEGESAGPKDIAQHE